MTFRHAWLVFILAALSQAEPIDVSISPPGGLDPEQVPQLILITFDDNTNNAMFDNVLKISAHTNQDGSPVGFTFFVCLDSPDFYNTHKLHAAGHEIAVHTVTHTTGNSTTAADWAREIAGCRQALIRYSGIPPEDLRGFRAPYLAYNADSFRVLHDMGFDYDSSVPETVPGKITTSYDSFIWPYHLHDGLKQHAYTGPAPDRSLPNLMAIPMWNLRTFNGNGYHTMDPGETSRENMLAMLKENFTTRYEGNRIPLGLWLHSGWASNDDNVAALNDFLEWALEQDHVWVVPVVKLVDWMRNPLPVDHPDLTDMLSVKHYPPTPESEIFTNNHLQPPLRTVGNPAHSFPNPGNLMLTVAEERVPLNFELVVVNSWIGNFTANLVVTNPAAHEVGIWNVKVTTPNAQITNLWDSEFKRTTEGGTVEPAFWTAPIPAHAEQHTVASFNSTGIPEGITLEGEGFHFSVFPTAPTLELCQDTGLFKWQNCAPIYELQGRLSLDKGEWNPLETFYGNTETPLPKGLPYHFFRVKAVH